MPDDNPPLQSGSEQPVAPSTDAAGDPIDVDAELRAIDEDYAASVSEDAAVAAPAEPADLDDDGLDEDEPLVYPGMNWFVLRVASNKEDSVRRALLRKIKIEDMEDLVNRILVPTEKTKTVKAGKSKVVETKLYPGYVFVEMKLEEDGRIPQDVFFLIKETTGVGDFIGTAGRPSPMSIPEIEKMQNAAKPAEDQPQVKMEFNVGDHIKINDGPFENTEGTIDETNPEQGRVKVLVTIFGRSTPVDLEYWQIERVDS